MMAGLCADSRPAEVESCGFRGDHWIYGQDAARMLRA
jgi:hypothetical protein